MSNNLAELAPFEDCRGLDGGECRVMYEQLMAKFRSPSSAMGMQTVFSTKTMNNLASLVKSENEVDSNNN